MPHAGDDPLDALMGHLGDFGKYQFYQVFLHLLAAFTAGMHMLSLVTVAAVPEHRCIIEGVENDTVLPWNTTEVVKWIPVNDRGEMSRCLVIDVNTNASMGCTKWTYDDTYYKTTRGTEWNFVCDRRWMSAVAQSSYMFGVFTGAVLLGSLADKYGRKTILYISAVLQFAFGTTIAFVTEFYLFLGLSFLYGIFGSAGAYIPAFVLTMELVGPSKRTVCGIMFQAFFAFGFMLVAIWGYFVKDHVTLQVIYGCHSLLLIGHWWLIDESPRWLWSQGKISQSVAVVDKGVRMNGGQPLDRAYFISKGNKRSSGDEKNEHQSSITDMFRTPFLRKKTLNLSLCWFSNSLLYYGLSLNCGSMSGDPYAILFIMGLVELPSYAITIFLMDKTGRRSLIATYMILGSVASYATTVVPPGMNNITNGIAFFGKFCISGSFAIVYNYSAELFPTVVRNTGLGFGSMCARFSATLTPLITLLDSFDKRVPSVVFATMAIVSGIFTMFLPETAGSPMPQSLEDGEKFGVGDTCFTSGCFGNDRKERTNDQIKPANNFILAKT